MWSMIRLTCYSSAHDLFYLHRLVRSNLLPFASYPQCNWRIRPIRLLTLSYGWRRDGIRNGYGLDIRDECFECCGGFDREPCPMQIVIGNTTRTSGGFAGGKTYLHIIQTAIGLQKTSIRLSSRPKRKEGDLLLRQTLQTKPTSTTS